MGEATTIACQPQAEEGMDGRVSQNFGTNQLPDEGHLIWRVITKMDDEDICFDVKQQCSTGPDQVRFENIKNGTIIPYVAHRNLYIASPQNATGHFIVRIESCE